MTRPRGNRTSQAVRDDRQKRIAEELARGTSRRDIQEKLQIKSRVTLWRSIRDLQRRSLLTLDPNDLRTAREAQGKILMKIEESLVSGKLPPEVVTAWVKLRESMARLFGLNAESRSLHLHASANTDALWLRFKKAISGLTDDQLESVFAFATGLAREKREVVRDASWFPAPEPKLLEGGDE
jgi:hypothetical protein